MYLLVTFSWRVVSLLKSTFLSLNYFLSLFSLFHFSGTFIISAKSFLFLFDDLRWMLGIELVACNIFYKNEH